MNWGRYSSAAKKVADISRIATQEAVKLWFRIDAMVGYGDEIYLTVKLWSKRAAELAAESLYD